MPFLVVKAFVTIILILFLPLRVRDVAAAPPIIFPDVPLENALGGFPFANMLFNNFNINLPLLVIMKYYALKAIPTASTAIILHHCWTSVKSYDAIVFCLHAISHTSTFYRYSLDRDGSILMLGFFLIDVLATFYLKSLFITVFLFVITSAIFKPGFAFFQNMMYKSFADLMFAFVKYLFNYPCDVTSTFTDIWYLGTFFSENALFIFTGNGKEDILLHALITSQLIVFICRVFDLKYLFFNIFVALLWICLKSFKIKRPLYSLTYLSFF